MVKSLYCHSRKYGGWSCELKLRGKLEICKLHIWGSPFLTIYFQIRNFIKTIKITKACKRIYQLVSSSCPAWPIELLCNLEMQNNHMFITFSSIIRLVNNTSIGLIIVNGHSLDTRQHHALVALNIKDEDYLPIHTLYKYPTPTICIVVDE
jgi:hypothetical protein